MRTIRERVLAAARRLAAQQPPDRVTLAGVARAAGVSWPTVRRHLGSRDRLRALLAEERSTPPVPDTRSRILAAAGRRFARDGYDGTSLDQVAADAGLTKGAVYWHFASKSDLFLALLEERVRRQLTRAPALARTFADSPRREEGLAAVLSTLLAAILDDPEWPRLSLEFTAHSHDPQIRERVIAFRRTTHEAVAAIIQELQDEGRLDPELHAAALAMLLSAVINGVVMNWLVDADELDPKPWIPEMARVLWRGARPPLPRRHPRPARRRTRARRNPS